MPVMSRRALAASTLAFVFAGCASRAGGAHAGRSALGSFGLDLSARDLAIKPGDDFYRHCNGTWIRTTEIPADRTSWGAFEMLNAKVDQDVKTLVEETAAAGGAPGTNEQKIADFYNAYVSQDAITARGLAPAEPDLRDIANLRTHADVLRLVGRPDIPVSFPIGATIWLDEGDPDRYAVVVEHGGLGLPDREYYRRSDGEFPNIRAQYQAHIARMLALGGQGDAERKAASILALETQIAGRHWPIEQRRERTLTYNKRTRTQLIALAPNFPWNDGLEAAGLGQVQEFVVLELSAIGPLADLVMATPVDTWKAYLTYHYLHNSAAVLPKPIDDENFDFFGRKLNGQPQQRDRWKRGVYALDSAIGEAVGQIYVRRHFAASSKAQMLELVENLRRAFGERIDQLTWMSPETKVAAREKLAAFRVKIGYPDRFRDYSALEIRAGDAFGNRKRATVFEWNRNLERLNERTDREEWGMTPQTVSAYYDQAFNEICFPAAVLQPPFFDPNADPAVNYGAIGGGIGHEMGHGFDDQGAKSDARGVLRDWWSQRDVDAFNARTQKLVEQYNAFEPLPGLRVNGQLTLGENIGDLGGLEMAYRAYEISTTPRERRRKLEGLTGDQRFFLSWGQSWRQLAREERLRTQILSDPHAPYQYRVNGVVRNIDAWYTAFDVQPGDALYLPPGERVRIW